MIILSAKVMKNKGLAKKKKTKKKPPKTPKSICYLFIRGFLSLDTYKT